MSELCVGQARVFFPCSWDIDATDETSMRCGTMRVVRFALLADTVCFVLSLPGRGGAVRCLFDDGAAYEIPRRVLVEHSVPLLSEAS